MIKVIIFDLGGVCFDIDWVKINNEMVKKFNMNILIKSTENEKAKQYYQEALEGKKNAKEIFRELNKDNYNLDEIVKFYKEVYKKYKKHNKKIYDLIKKLKNKYMVVCLSDTNTINFEAHQEQETIKDFHKVFTSFQIGSIKKDANTFKKVINNLSLKPEEALFIDDNAKNIEVAKSIDMQTINYIDYENLVKELKAHKII